MRHAWSGDWRDWDVEDISHLGYNVTQEELAKYNDIQRQGLEDHFGESSIPDEVADEEIQACIERNWLMWLEEACESTPT